MKNRYIQNTTYIICVFILILTANSCSTTKLLTADETLYTGVKKIRINKADSIKIPSAVINNIEEPLLIKPNNPFINAYMRTPFPLGLWAYNYLTPKKKKGLRHWLYEKLAKEPILIQNIQPNVRTKVVEDILRNQGYFGSKASYVLVPTGAKKAKISYNITIAPPVTYDSISYPQGESPLIKMINRSRSESLLKVGNQYNTDTLSAERVRISNYLRENGFFFFRPDYLEYLADSSQHKGYVNLRVVLKKGIPQQAMNAYKIGKINVSLQSASGKGDPDTIQLDRMTVAYQKPLKVRRTTLKRTITLMPGEIYSLSAQNNTQTRLGKLGIFRYININVTPLDSLNGDSLLRVQIDAAMDTPLESQFEVDVTSKSNSFIGPGVTFGVNHNNIFHGGEDLGVKLNGSYEWQTGKKANGGKSSLLNSYEFGTNISLGFPRLFVPRFIHQNKFGGRTTFQLGVDLMNRPHYFRIISFSGSANYDFQTSKVSYHTLTPFKIVYNKLLNTTSSFESTLNENPAIALSFKNQFIPSMGYTYTLDKSIGSKQNQRILFQTSVTQAGNIFDGIYRLIGIKGEKRILGNPFSQFIKGTTEIKYYKRLWGDNWLASRFMIGAGHAYSNSKVLPYSEQFYIGGANSIRAFTIRSLGPGSFRPAKDNTNGYFDQTGDFKLEANIELRLKIIGNLQGAVFLDAGNIWLLKNDPLRPGGALRKSTFLKDIALGTGVGLRYDITYIVLRADLGIGIHAPYATGKSGYYNMTSFMNSLGFHLAIGYPF